MRIALSVRQPWAWLPVTIYADGIEQPSLFSAGDLS